MTTTNLISMSINKYWILEWLKSCAGILNRDCLVIVHARVRTCMFTLPGRCWMIKSLPVIITNLAYIYHYVPCFSCKLFVYSNNVHAHARVSPREYRCVCMYIYLRIRTHVCACVCVCTWD